MVPSSPFAHSTDLGLNCRAIRERPHDRLANRSRRSLDKSSVLTCEHTNTSHTQSRARKSRRQGIEGKANDRGVPDSGSLNSNRTSWNRKRTRMTLSRSRRARILRSSNDGNFIGSCFLLYFFPQIVSSRRDPIEWQLSIVYLVHSFSFFVLSWFCREVSFRKILPSTKTRLRLLVRFVRKPRC